MVEFEPERISSRRVVFREAKGDTHFRPAPNVAHPQPTDRGTEPPPTATRRISTWFCRSRLRPAIPRLP